MRIDAHQHFWDLSRGDYGWLTPDLAPIYRDFGPADLEPLLTDHGIEGTIVVQAAPTVAETEYMLELAAASPFIKGVVGWVDFENPSAPDQINDLAENPKLVGLRPMIQDIDDDDWMLREDLTPAFEALIAADLAFDALTLPQHLENLGKLLKRHPTMRTVIDHGSKPQIRERLFDQWAERMAWLGAQTGAYCKLSGLVTEANPDWSTMDLHRYVEHLLVTFGPDRLIWGSDWPVCTLAASYDRWVDVTHTLIGHLPVDSQSAILGGNALAAYKISG